MELVFKEDAVYIENAKLGDLKKAIKDFCGNYNQGEKVVFPNLYVLNENTFSITFKNLFLLTFLDI